MGGIGVAVGVGGMGVGVGGTGVGVGGIGVAVGVGGTGVGVGGTGLGVGGIGVGVGGGGGGEPHAARDKLRPIATTSRHRIDFFIFLSLLIIIFFIVSPLTSKLITPFLPSLLLHTNLSFSIPFFLKTTSSILKKFNSIVHPLPLFVLIFIIFSN